jgi:hypothetical protein
MRTIETEATLADGREVLTTDDGQAWVKDGQEKVIVYGQFYIVAPLPMLDSPLETKLTTFTSEDGAVSYLTARQWCEVTSAQWQPIGETHFMLPFATSDLDNDFTKVKEKATNNGLIMAGYAFDSTDPRAVWVLNHGEYQEWRKANPMVQPVDES